MRNESEVPFHRARGRTTRVLWRSLLKASEQPFCTNGQVVVIVDTDPLVNWTFDYLLRLAEPVINHGPQIREPFKINRPTHRLTFPNGASILVTSVSRAENSCRGFSNLLIIRD